jgi:predicted TIM-barrel fold metal-dependent hydrolase
VGQQLFVDSGIDYAIIIPQGPLMAPTVDPERSAAVSSAINAWLAATWLSKDNPHGRYYGSISVAVNNPTAAAREIDEWAGHPRFVQVFIPHHGGAPYGQERFWPIWEAAHRNRIPIVMHVNGGGTDMMITPAGFFQRFLEYHGVGYPLTYAAHLTSFLFEGVFDKFPDFRVVFAEGGFTWIAPLLWRLDKNWASMKHEIPSIKQRPSQYIRDRVRFTSQPVEEPEDPHAIVDAYSLADAEHLLMFSSDYPHFDFDNPIRAVSNRLPAALRARILAGNALEFYGLPPTRRVSEFDRAAALPLSASEPEDSSS